MVHCGLQNPSKPLRFIAAMIGRFARNGNAINVEAPSTNLGHSNSAGDLVKGSPSGP
jgi:hypothetical protein